MNDDAVIHLDQLLPGVFNITLRGQASPHRATIYNQMRDYEGRPLYLSGKREIYNWKHVMKLEKLHDIGEIND